MSRESRRRKREAKQRPLKRKSRWIISTGAIVVIIFSGVVAWQHFKVKRPLLASVASPSVFFKMPASYAELCAVNTNDLGKCDIALMNLLCAKGLAGSENLNVTNCLKALDNIATSVKYNTERYYYKFREHPEEFNHSEGYFDMMMLATVLQEDFNIHYNPAHVDIPGQTLEPNKSFYANSQDVFIHGLAHKDGLGTCSSMPVFYIAIGRRLGYPLKMVKAKGHLFARWEDHERSFNIECTSIGFVSHTDDEYRTWPAPFTPEEEKSDSYLKSLTPVQELTVFLSIRGFCFGASGDLKKSLGAFAQAFYKEPQSIAYQKLFARAEREVYKAGLLPKPAELQYALRKLELPNGPMHDHFAQEKALIEARNVPGANFDDLETDLLALKAEMALYQ